MMRKLMVLLALCLMAAGANALPSLNDYAATTSLKINITQPMGAQTDYQIKFIISNASGVSGYYDPDNVIFTNGSTRPDWYDINATDDLDAPLNLWVENTTQTANNATVWVKIPTIAIDNSSGMKWRYGNSSQTVSTSDGLNAFLLFDDFLGSSINATKWSSSGATITVSDGTMSFVRSGAGASSVSSASTFGVNTSTRSYTRSGKNTVTIHIDRTGYLGFLWTGTEWQAQSYVSATQSTSLGNTYPSGYNIFEIGRNANINANYYVNNTLVATHASQVPTGSYAERFSAPPTNGGTIYVDWVIIRKYVVVEPTTSSYITTATILPPTAAFTANADFISSTNPSTINSSVVFTDTSTGTPTTWNWTIDGSVTNTTQNIAYTFATTGAHSIDLNVTNSTGSFSNMTHTHTVTNVTSFTQQDIYLTGQYTITFNVKSSTTNLPIANVTVVDAVSGQSYPSTNGTAFLTEPAGLIYVNFIADGYQTKQITYVVDQDETHEVKLVPSAPASGGTSNWYSPHQVRFAVVDSREAKVVGAGINASVIVSTFPQDGTADWLTEMYGINADVANDMLNGTLIMHGTTQSDGATVFTMHSSIGYSLAVTNPSNGVIQTVNVTPIDTIYTIHLLGSAANNTYMDMGYNTSLYVTEPDVHNVTMNLAYQDMSARTTLLEFFVLARSNNTVINYQSTSSTGSNVILMNFTVPNIKPDRYSWYYNAVRIK